MYSRKLVNTAHIVKTVVLDNSILIPEQFTSCVHYLIELVFFFLHVQFFEMRKFDKHCIDIRIAQLAMLTMYI